MKKLYFITGSQDLYGDETLAQVAVDSKTMVENLSKKLNNVCVEWQPTVRNSDEVYEVCLKATADPDCVGVITWMHTFSPAKMWIRGLKALTKPMLHLHTQANEKLPYKTIDMDFMNLNQSAHGDREFGFICARMNVKREVVVGYYENPDVIAKIAKFADVAIALAYSQTLRVAMFGNNMRDVAVTDGDRVESEIRYGWNVNYYGIGDLVKIANEVSEAEITAKMQEYTSKYEMNTDKIDSVKEQAKYEVALDKFIAKNRIGAFTDTFQDLHGLRQLPGIAVQNVMSKGVGFGPEGDYKTSALMAVLCKMAENKKGATAFIEDYTYDLTAGSELELASHMLEVSPVFAKNTPKIEVHHLGIGDKEPPARLVFDGVAGDAIAVSMVDMGDRFRLICAKIEMVEPPYDMPALPVARLMWKLKPDFPTGAAAWVKAGGAHHAVVSTALDVADIRLFAKLTDTELIVIDEKTELPFGA